MDPAVEAILQNNMSDLVALEEAVGGVPKILSLVPHFESIYNTFRAQPKDQDIGVTVFKVLRANGGDVLAIEEAIGIRTVAANWSHINAIYKTYSAAKAAEKK